MSEDELEKMNNEFYEETGNDNMNHDSLKIARILQQSMDQINDNIKRNIDAYGFQRTLFCDLQSRDAFECIMSRIPKEKRLIGHTRNLHSAFYGEDNIPNEEYFFLLDKNRMLKLQFYELKDEEGKPHYSLSVGSFKGIQLNMRITPPTEGFDFPRAYIINGANISKPVYEFIPDEDYSSFDSKDLALTGELEIIDFSELLQMCEEDTKSDGVRFK